MTHDTLDDRTRRRVRDYKRLGLNDNATDLLRRRYGTTTREIEALQTLVLVTTGRRYVSLTDEPYVLTESMTDDWWGDRDYVRDGLLAKGLIERTTGHRGKVYFVPTGDAFDLLINDHPFDLNESWQHKRAVALLRTVCQGLLHIRGITAYAPIGQGDKRCDLRVIPKSREFRREMGLPGEDPILAEVMGDHHNTERVVQRYRALHAANCDGVWVFPNRPTMNKWIRRLAARGELPRVAEQYEWSATTPITTVQKRVMSWDIPGMRYVTTIDRVEGWIDDCPDKWDRLANAPNL